MGFQNACLGETGELHGVECRTYWNGIAETSGFEEAQRTWVKRTLSTFRAMQESHDVQHAPLNETLELAFDVERMFADVLSDAQLEQVHDELSEVDTMLLVMLVVSIGVAALLYVFLFR